jgi:dihydroorotase
MARSPIPAVDVFDREAVFIDTVLRPLLREFPKLKLVLEHITTRDGIDLRAGARSPMWRAP